MIGEGSNVWEYGSSCERFINFVLREQSNSETGHVSMVYYLKEHGTVVVNKIM